MYAELSCIPLKLMANMIISDAEDDDDRFELWHARYTTEPYVILLINKQNNNFE